MPLQEYDAIRIKPGFENTLGEIDAINAHRNRTQGKDQVARHIVDEVLAEGRWPIMMTQLAEETGYSRQHCANVVSDYFEPVKGTSVKGDTGADRQQTNAQRTTTATTSTTDTDSGIEDGQTVFVEVDGLMREVTVPAGVDRASYVQGWADCVKNN